MSRLRLALLSMVAVLTVYSLSFLVHAFVKSRSPRAQSVNEVLPKLAELSQSSSVRRGWFDCFNELVVSSVANFLSPEFWLCDDKAHCILRALPKVDLLQPSLPVARTDTTSGAFSPSSLFSESKA